MKGLDVYKTLVLDVEETGEVELVEGKSRIEIVLDSGEVITGIVEKVAKKRIVIITDMDRHKLIIEIGDVVRITLQ